MYDQWLTKFETIIIIIIKRYLAWAVGWARPGQARVFSTVCSVLLVLCYVSALRIDLGLLIVTAFMNSFRSAS